MVKETLLGKNCLAGRNGKPCVYLGRSSGVKTCDYCLITGQLRGTPIRKCRHWRDEKAAQAVVDGVSISIPPRRKGERHDT